MTFTRPLYTHLMRKTFRLAILTLGAFFVASSLALAAQASPTPAPGAAKPTAERHAKPATKAKKRSGKKGARKKVTKKPAAR